jgi:hypothetical protein
LKSKLVNRIWIIATAAPFATIGRQVDLLSSLYYPKASS